MASTRIDYTTMEWSSGIPFYGPAAVYDGKDIVQLKVLSDRRKDGGGIAWLVKMTPPPGKLIKIVAVALSDEHVFSLQGGRSTKSGERAQGAGGYGLNPKGPAAQRHDRRGDDGAGDLCGRARRDPVDGGCRHRRGRLRVAFLAPDAQQEDRALAAAAGLLLHFGEFVASLVHPAVEHALGHPSDDQEGPEVDGGHEQRPHGPRIAAVQVSSTSAFSRARALSHCRETCSR